MVWGWGSTVFAAHIHDVQGRAREGYPVKGLSRAQAIDLLADPPVWTDSLLIFNQDTGRQLVVGFTNRPQSRVEGRPVLDLIVVPDDWRDEVYQRRLSARSTAEEAS